MVQPYEVVYIFDSTLEEPAITERLEKFHALVRLEGETPAFNHWGRRQLAYPIKKKETGYYVVANFHAEPAALPEYERALKLDEGVLRYLLVLNDVPPTPAHVPTGKDDEEDDE